MPRDQLVRRFGQLSVGLLLYGLSMALMIQSSLGLGPWDVFHQGVAKRVPVSFGVVVIAVSLVVLLLWIPLKQKPGIGTVANAFVVGAATDLGLWLFPVIHQVAWGIAAMVLAIGANALAGALYIGAGLGPGPRDGLMTGLVRRGVGSVFVVRSCLEGTVLLIGWLLGGTVFVGTVLYAATIGPCLHWMMPIFHIKPRPPATEPAGAGPEQPRAGAPESR
ncbi:hypothetical protein EH165_05760 [Nakamurella antarctica]|uniref:Membrane protein YczE n=1 Tax=Nakamurella antarctica TaxID=1902245 RepID=A0A3G8ZQ92_9ACTN|nr:hypothetical protein EH165_05760 [Nakamurella antarctica]